MILSNKYSMPAKKNNSEAMYTDIRTTATEALEYITLWVLVDSDQKHVQTLPSQPSQHLLSSDKTVVIFEHFLETSIFSNNNLFDKNISKINSFFS